MPTPADLTDGGMPTVVFDTRVTAESHEIYVPEERNVFVSYPRVGKHIAFDGLLLHGCADELSVAMPSPSTTSPIPPEHAPDPAAGSAIERDARTHNGRGRGSGAADG